jgi:hypothetical protein
MQRLRGLLAAVLVLALAACGGSPHKNIESVQSLATEGALLARQSERGDATSVFVRVHAGYLKQEANKLAHALAGQRELRASRVASAVARDLERLRHGAAVSADLERLAERAERLAK